MPNYSQSSRTLYRSRQGWIFGVCQGLAEYGDIPVFWVRIATFLACLFTGFWPMVLIYIVAAIFLKPAPVIEFTSDEDWDFYQAYTADRKRALMRLRKRCEVLDRRTRRMENVVTNREFNWDRRFQSGT
ncbi:envelope stress response membrane protein PspC [Puniceicoccales bacterium CK1056]|uniref:Envelope stress response membrane protein PspC n=1 Tax=Oceanipulchritudo coccoides TaxID=2706888 RepID=A0A6B2M154_9BACT|nr:envelope stress response membrane protein PspC [Oceanipulchritudo coccoides]NDV62721.1 envelope stress response membrane protein PspC [Oceanipulchritudo coccoides]